MAQRLGIRRPRVAGRVPAGLLVKASAPTSLPGGLALPAGSSVTDATSMLGALQARTARAVNGSVPLPRDQGFWALFGPGAPLYPSPLNTPNPMTGQADPRSHEYPVSWNIQSNQRYIPWTTLRAAAEKVDIIRLCLKVRKAEICQLDWDITLTKRAQNMADANTAVAKKALRDQYADKIDDLTDFWSNPDTTNDMDWSSWLGMLLEERFVLDATSIFPRLTYGQDLASLEIVDGATIKPLLNEYGNTPAPPAPVYQQWLYGFPRGEYHDDGVGEWEATRGGLIYKPQTRRTLGPYGLPEVEQALVTAEVYLRRQDWMRQEYTSGTLPTTFMKTDAEIGQMTPEQYRMWNGALNDYLAGDTQARHRLQMLPLGFDPMPTQDAAERYKPDYDELLIKLLVRTWTSSRPRSGSRPATGSAAPGSPTRRRM